MVRDPFNYKEEEKLSLKKITTPDFGSATDVTVIEILIKPGDKVGDDTPIMILESDKATMELPAGKVGVVKEIKVKVGDKITTGSELITLEADEVKEEKLQEKHKEPEEKKELKEEPEKGAQGEKQPKKAAKAAPLEKEKTEIETPEVLSGTLQSMSDIHAGPGVRRFARELGVNLSLVPGTGPKHRILKEDVQSFVKTQLSAGPSNFPVMLPSQIIDFTKFGPTETVSLSRIKRISGKNLQRNWILIPHVTQFGAADITTLEEFRQAQKKELEKQNIKLTPLVFVMKAVVASLKEFPQFNASLDPSGEHLILKKYINLGVAVDTPDGLIVPVVRDVDKKGLVELAKELATLSEKARKKQLMPNELQGGCFSISSLGGIGGTAFTPIINAPEVAILGVSKSSYQGVFQDGEFVPRLMLPLSLSFDHRVIDGAEGARFLVYLSNMLTDIRNLLM